MVDDSTFLDVELRKWAPGQRSALADDAVAFVLAKVQDLLDDEKTFLDCQVMTGYQGDLMSAQYEAGLPMGNTIHAFVIGHIISEVVQIGGFDRMFIDSTFLNLSPTFPLFVEPSLWLLLRLHATWWHKLHFLFLSTFIYL